MRLRLLFLFLVSTFFGPVVAAANGDINVGPKECNECHEREFDVWKKTPHSTSLKSLHKTKEAKKIVKAIGGKSIKRDKNCVLCHYTKIGKKQKVKAGPSCESCHGAAENWIDVHNDFGKGIKKPEDESATHKTQRLADADKAGMFSSRKTFDIATNCMTCHGLGNTNLKEKSLNVMLENDHPIEKDFEIVAYSQGALRHRFTDEEGNTNYQLKPAGTARLFIAGQMAALIASNSVKGKIKNDKFNKAQDHRIKMSRKNLSLVNSVASVKAFLAKPTADNARKVMAEIGNKDLSKQLESVLPKEADYKNKFEK